MKHPQLTLALDTEPGATFRTYFASSRSTVALAALHAMVDDAPNSVMTDATPQQLFLWGELGCGKTHLLSAACADLVERGCRVAYLPGELIGQDGAVEGLEAMDLVCLDDLQRLDRHAEVALFHAINRCRERGARLLLAADRVPDELGVQLPDLATRLSWGPVFQINTLNDAELADAIASMLDARSLAFSREVPPYLLKRWPRDIAALKRVINTLDAASLVEQRRVTIPWIRQVLPGVAEAYPSALQR